MSIFTKTRHTFAKLIKLWIRPHLDSAPSTESSITSDYFVLANESITDLIAAEMMLAKMGKSPSISQWRSISKDQGVLFSRNAPSAVTEISELIERVRQGETINLIPTSVIWGRSPERENSLWKLIFSYNNYQIAGSLRKFFATILHRKEITVSFGEPIQLGEQIKSTDNDAKLARKIHRVMRIHFRRRKARIQGPELSQRKSMANSIVRSERVQQAISIEAEKEGEEVKKLEEKALKYCVEISANYNTRSIRILEIVLDWFWNKIYSGIHTEGIDRIKPLADDHTIVYLPCHRSHVDYLLLSYTLFHKGLMPPHIAAGINLNMPLIGRLLRGCGAFFIRRSFRGKPLYTAVFNEYLHTLLTRGFPVEFFIEGGRSRTGRTLTPKTGMLALMIRSYLRDSSKPIALVPIYVGYEKILEEGSYLGELRGATKKKESFLDIFSIFKRVKQNFGTVRANFGEPLLLDEFLNQEAPGWKEANEERPDWLQPVTNKLGAEISIRINSAAHANAAGLVATAMLGTPRQAIGEEILRKQLSTYQEILARVPYSGDTTLSDKTPQALIERCEWLDVIGKKTDSMGNVYYLDDRNSVLLTYYRNNIQHLFALPSFLAFSLLWRQGLTRNQLVSISIMVYPFIKRELYMNHTGEALEKSIVDTLDVLIDLGLLIEKRGRISAPADGTESRAQQILLAAIVQPTVERFYFVLKLLEQEKCNTVEELEKKSTEIAERMSLINGINSPEFSDKKLFKAFLEELSNHDFISEKDNQLCVSDDLSSLLNIANKIVSPNLTLSLDLIGRH